MYVYTGVAYLYIYIHLSIYLPTYLPICPSIYPSIYSIYPSVQQKCAQGKCGKRAVGLGSSFHNTGLFGVTGGTSCERELPACRRIHVLGVRRLGFIV